MTFRHPGRVRRLVQTAGFARADNRTRANLELWQRSLAAGDRESFARIALLAGFIPGARYIELPGGHMVMGEQPQRWHAAVLDFVSASPTRC
ncbi:alpha/beta fold hydrolase [Nocardia sp. NPDC127579]|uniref:alpha/beta fold hydrolase n=1 Tax=Nocardia sp. NPDC127579 TaxID=3345402 RepID=UPI0036450EE3